MGTCEDCAEKALAMKDEEHLAFLKDLIENHTVGKEDGKESPELKKILKEISRLESEGKEKTK